MKKSRQVSFENATKRKPKMIQEAFHATQKFASSNGEDMNEKTFKQAYKNATAEQKDIIDLIFAKYKCKIIFKDNNRFTIMNDENNTPDKLLPRLEKIDMKPMKKLEERIKALQDEKTEHENEIKQLEKELKILRLQKRDDIIRAIGEVMQNVGSSIKNTMREPLKYAADHVLQNPFVYVCAGITLFIFCAIYERFLRVENYILSFFQYDPIEETKTGIENAVVALAKGATNAANKFAEKVNDASESVKSFISGVKNSSALVVYQSEDDNDMTKVMLMVGATVGLCVVICGICKYGAKMIIELEKQAQNAFQRDIENDDQEMLFEDDDNFYDENEDEGPTYEELMKMHQFGRQTKNHNFSI